MFRKFVKRVWPFSFAICMIWLACLVVGNFASPSLSIFDEGFVGLTNSIGLDGEIVFYSDSETGPYFGSVISLVGDDSVSLVGSFDFPGIYYRHFQDTAGIALWTLAISLWYPIILFAIAPALEVFFHWKQTLIKRS